METTKPQHWLNKFLDTFFHLPTLITMALLSAVLLWQIYDIGFNISAGSVRLNSNQGHLTLYWANGCCDLEW